MAEERHVAPFEQPERPRGLLQPSSQWPLADDQGADVGPDVLEEVEGREQGVDPLLLGQSAGEQDQGRPDFQPQARPDLGRVDDGRLFVGDPRGDHRQFLGRDADLSIEIDHRVRVAHDPVGPSGQEPVDRQFRPPFPEVDCHLAGHDHRHLGPMGGDPPVGVGRVDPGLDHVEPLLLQEPGQPPQGHRVDLVPLADHRDRDARPVQVGLQRPEPRQGGDLDPEPVARQPLGQQDHLLLGPRAVEGGDQLEDVEHEGVHR